MTEPTMRWSKVKKVSKTKDEDTFIPIGKRKDVIGALHDNCKGCQHLRKGVCPYVVTPRQKKFPCFFRENLERRSAEAISEISKIFSKA